MPEAELLAYVVFAGLPMPEVNVAIEVAPGVELTPDLWFADYDLAVEYEGSQHQEDRAQYIADIDRYATLPPARRALRADHQGAAAVTEGDRAVVHAALVAAVTTVRRRSSASSGTACSGRVADLVRRHRAA